MDTLNTQQQQALDYIKQGYSIMITGRAGTGKSYLIQHIIKYAYEKYPSTNANIHHVGVTALTGIAAFQIQGKTIHSWSGIRLAKDPADVILKMMNRDARSRWIHCNLLIIDEVSMMSQRIFNLLDTIAKSVRECDAPFGGIQVVACGDFMQLPPVNDDSYCFMSPVWNSLFKHTIVLNQVFRQNNEAFIQQLEYLRWGKYDNLSYFLPCIMKPLSCNLGIVPTKLYSTRSNVQLENQTELNKLSTPSHTFISQDVVYDRQNRSTWLKILDDQCMAPRELELKKGAQVMLVYNINVNCGLVNGSRGVIQDIKDDQIMVQFMHMIYPIKRHIFEFSEHGKCKAIRKQYPLMLAWALTIHKCQGLSLDYVQVDLSNIFTAGQLYVALSRVRTFEGLSIIMGDETDPEEAKHRFLNIKSHVDPCAIAYYQSLNNNQ